MAGDHAGEVHLVQLCSDAWFVKYKHEPVYRSQVCVEQQFCNIAGRQLDPDKFRYGYQVTIRAESAQRDVSLQYSIGRGGAWRGCIIAFK